MSKTSRKRRLSAVLDFADNDYSNRSDIDVLFSFDEPDEGDMYLGNAPVRIDWNTAQYILRQRESMPESMPWGSFFPAVTNHTSAAYARSHPEFDAA